MVEEHAKLNRLHSELCKNGNIPAAGKIVNQMFDITAQIMITR